ncbi:MAG: ion transporter [Actinomycetota bacterium]|nr:ion transporter [Actinomycetota bacterium]
MTRPVEKKPLARLVDSPFFAAAVLAAIVANAVILGMQTYDGLVRDHGQLLDLLNELFLLFFVVELALRLASYGSRPQRFFRDGWNIFDFVVVGAAFVPGIRESSTLLRLARLLRIVRVVRLLPELRVLTLAVARSLPPLFSMSVLTALILFVYGMVGWLLYDEHDPQRWGDIGRAMLTLFVVLTLENFPVYLERGMEIHPWSFVYFVSFVLVAAFIIVNLLIGVVLNSMEEARQIHAREDLRARGLDAGDEEAAIATRIAALRTAIAELEHELVLSQGDGRTMRSSRRGRSRPG